MTNVKYIEPMEAFSYAIERGTLSAHEQDNNYAGNYMYMGSTDTSHHFKHIMTRSYVNCYFDSHLSNVLKELA